MSRTSPGTIGVSRNPLRTLIQENGAERPPNCSVYRIVKEALRRTPAKATRQSLTVLLKLVHASVEEVVIDAEPPIVAYRPLINSHSTAPRPRARIHMLRHRAFGAVYNRFGVDFGSICRRRS